jgi:regulatory protein SWI5
MSLDQRPRPQSPSQDHVGIITNQGFQQKQQHILREAQQQRLARPGQLQQSPYLTYTHNNDENYLISPLVSPQRQDFDPGYMNNYGASCQPTQQYLGFSGQIDTTIKVNTSEFSHGNSFISDSYHGLPLTPSTFLDFSAQYDDVAGQQDWGMTIKPSTRQSSRRRISGGIANRVAQFENMAEQPVSRPTTPPNHNGSSKKPNPPQQHQN